jgi:hypothetical protein
MYIVLGGELKDLQGAPEFRDCAGVEFVGAYATHEDAVRAWRARAQQTVDNALARYFIVDAHKMLAPAA